MSNPNNDGLNTDDLDVLDLHDDTAVLAEETESGFALCDEEDDPLGLTGPVPTEDTPAQPSEETGFALQDEAAPGAPQVPVISEAGRPFWRSFLFSPRKVFQNRTLSRKIGTPRVEDLDYDPAFYDSVREGLMPPEEAKFRGSRDGFAQMLCKLHDIPMLLARKVAENRLTVDEARQMVEEKALLSPEAVEERLRAAEQRRKQSTAGSILWPLTTAAAITGLMAYGLYTAMPETAVSSEPAPVGTAHVVPTGDAPTSNSIQTIRQDAEGRLTYVSSDSPESVLTLFSKSVEDIVPIGVGLPDAMDDAYRVGLLQDRSTRGWPRKAFDIRFDRDRWIAGDGLRPIPLATAPDESQLVDVVRVGPATENS